METMNREEFVGQLAGKINWIGYKYALADQDDCEIAAEFIAKWLEEHEILDISKWKK